MEQQIGCSDGGCILKRPVGMVTNGRCTCPVVGERNPHVSQEDRMKLKTAFLELQKEIKSLKAEALIKESIHKQKVTRMETALYNIISNSKQKPQTQTDIVNVEVATRGLSEPGGLKELLGKLNDI